MALYRGNSGFKHFQIVRNETKAKLIRNTSVTKKLVLYGDEASPPVRFAMMTASLLNIELEFHKIDLFKAENQSQFYKKINPLQKVPALSVNGDIICDSHAIALYFCRNSNNQELYPKEIMLKTKIDEWLYFDAGVLFPIDSAIFVSLRFYVEQNMIRDCNTDVVPTEFFAGKWPADEVKVNNWYSSLDHLELKLYNQKWLTGDKMRLCDVCCGTTVSSLIILIPLLERHGNVKKWLSMLNKLSCVEINKRGLKRLKSLVEIRKQQ